MKKKIPSNFSTFENVKKTFFCVKLICKNFYKARLSCLEINICRLYFKTATQLCKKKKKNVRRDMKHRFAMSLYVLHLLVS